MMRPSLVLVLIVYFLQIDLFVNGGYEQQPQQASSSYIPPPIPFNSTGPTFPFVPRLPQSFPQPTPSVSHNIFQSFQQQPINSQPQQQQRQQHLFSQQQHHQQQQRGPQNFPQQQPQFNNFQQYHSEQNGFTPLPSFSDSHPQQQQHQQHQQQQHQHQHQHQHQQFSSQQPVFFTPNPYLPQYYPVPLFNPGSHHAGSGQFGNPFIAPGIPGGYQKQPPIFIDPSIGLQNFYNAPMYMKKRTIQDICASIAPEEKTVIYVLSQNPEFAIDKVDLPPPTKSSKPEVFFIKYNKPEEADLAQKHIQAQYDALGGTSEVSNETLSPVDTAENILKSNNISINAVDTTSTGYIKKK